MKVLRISLFCCFLFVIQIAFSQENSLILHVEEFRSDNIVFKDSKEHFFEKFGKPEISRKKELLICDTMYSIEGRHYSSKVIPAYLYFYPTKGLTYCGIGDSVRLVAIDLKKMKGAKIYFRDLILDSNFIMETLVRKFNLVEDEHYLNFPSMFYEETCDGKPVYCYFISFYTDILVGSSIDFGFDDNKQRILRFIYFPYNYNNGGIIPVKMYKRQSDG